MRSSSTTYLDCNTVRLTELSTSVQPEPKTSDNSRNVAFQAMQELRQLHTADSVVSMLDQRREFGRRKYGTPLLSHNGRDANCDAAQEMLDALVYVTQAKMEGRDTRELLPLAQTLLRVVISGCEE